MRCTEPQPALPRPAAQALEQLLSQSQGNLCEAACQFGVSHSILHNRIQQLQLGVRHAQWRGPGTGITPEPM